MGRGFIGAMGILAKRAASHTKGGAPPSAQRPKAKIEGDLSGRHDGGGRRGRGRREGGGAVSEGKQAASGSKPVLRSIAESLPIQPGQSIERVFHTKLYRLHPLNYRPLIVGHPFGSPHDGGCGRDTHRFCSRYRSRAQRRRGAWAAAPYHRHRCHC